MGKQLHSFAILAQLSSIRQSEISLLRHWKSLMHDASFNYCYGTAAASAAVVMQCIYRSSRLNIV